MSFSLLNPSRNGPRPRPYTSASWLTTATHTFSDIMNGMLNGRSNHFDPTRVPHLIYASTHHPAFIDGLRRRCFPLGKITQREKKGLYFMSSAPPMIRSDKTRASSLLCSSKNRQVHVGKGRKSIVVENHHGVR